MSLVDHEPELIARPLLGGVAAVADGGRKPAELADGRRDQSDDRPPDRPGRHHDPGAGEPHQQQRHHDQRQPDRGNPGEHGGEFEGERAVACHRHQPWEGQQRRPHRRAHDHRRRDEGNGFAAGDDFVVSLRAAAAAAEFLNRRPLGTSHRPRLHRRKAGHGEQHEARFHAENSGRGHDPPRTGRRGGRGSSIAVITARSRARIRRRRAGS